MSLTPGYILAEDHTSIGLTLTEIAVIVAEWDAGYGPKRPVAVRSEHGTEFAPLVISWMTYQAAGPGLLLERGDVRYYLCEQDDIAEMRAVLAAQQEPDTHPRAAAEERIVSTLASLMRDKLAQRRHHGDWREMAASTAMDALRGEVEELRLAFFGCCDPEAIIAEAVDVAAYCAILIDVLSAEAER